MLDVAMIEAPSLPAREDVGESPSQGHLRALALAGATGLLICEAPGVRIDTFLLEGRIAWAMSHAQRSSFAAHLNAAANVAPETLREVVNDCRHTGQALGQALVMRGLATLDTLRTALAHEIARTLAHLGTLDARTRRFVDGGVVGYDAQLTFDLAELIPDAPRARTGSRAARPRDALGEWPGSAQELRSRVDGLAWVEFIELDQAVDADPPSPSRRTPSELVRSSVLDGASAVAVRTAHHSVIGIDLGRGRSAWCGLRDDISLGAVVLALEGVLGGSRLNVRRHRTATDRAAWTLGVATVPGAAVLTSLLAREPDIVGALVLSAGDEAPLVGMGARSLSPAWALDIARRRSPCLTAGPASGAAPDPHPPSGSEPVGMQVVVAEDLWGFGVELDDGTILWLFIDRSAELGLGWFHLGALARDLRLAMRPRPRTIRGLGARALPPPAAMV